MDIKLNLSYYASIMLDAFKDLLCCHNRPRPTKWVIATQVRTLPAFVDQIARNT